MTTDTSERGLERLICTALTGFPCVPGSASTEPRRESPAARSADWIGGSPNDYDREYCVDLVQLSAFLQETQPNVADALDLGQDSPTRRKFLARLQGEISKRGTIDVLRHGIKQDLITSICSTGRRRRVTQRPPSGMTRTASASHANSVTAVTRRSVHSTWACSSTGSRSPRSN